MCSLVIRAMWYHTHYSDGSANSWWGRYRFEYNLPGQPHSRSLMSKRSSSILSGVNCHFMSGKEENKIWQNLSKTIDILRICRQVDHVSLKLICQMCDSTKQVFIAMNNIWVMSQSLICADPTGEFYEWLGCEGPVLIWSPAKTLCWPFNIF